jgi:hypothetical protein
MIHYAGFICLAFLLQTPVFTFRRFLCLLGQYLLVRFTMNVRKLLAAVVLALAFMEALSASAVVRGPQTAHYSSSQLKRMIHDARTQDQYLVLARYFEQRHKEYSDKASDEMAEWARRSPDVSGPAMKYPRPVDAARNLYDYYRHEADDAAFQAEKFHRFADGVAALNRH